MTREEKNIPESMRVFLEKWPTPEKRKEACELLKAHLRNGQDLKLWHAASYEEILKLMETFPEEFNKKDIFDAFRAGVSEIEKAGIWAARGKAKEDFDCQAFRLVMMNKAGWRDKVETYSIAEINEKLSEIAEKMYAVAVKYIPKPKLKEFTLEMQGAIRGGIPDGQRTKA